MFTIENIKGIIMTALIASFYITILICALEWNNESKEDD